MKQGFTLDLFISLTHKIYVSETWISKYMHKNMITVDKYKIFRHVRLTENDMGVCKQRHL